MRSRHVPDEGLKAASTGADGNQYFVPVYNYPWVVMYRKSVWEEGLHRPYDHGRVQGPR